jgi:hypothetical protein
VRGFNTKKAQSCKDGGLIRGPGTGTSDSIPRGFKPGTFIMPADSTKAIGPDVLESIAKVPTKVSNGEFAHTPQEVHAVGINALRMMKDATHSPKDAGVYFANGGAVQGRGAKGFAIGGEVTNDVTRIGNSYSGGNIGGNITVNGQQPSGTFSSSSPVPTPAPPRPAPVAPVVQAVQYMQPSTPATTPATPALSAMATPPATPQAVAKPVDSFTARNNAVSASSITNNGGRFDTTPAVPSTAPVDTSVTPRRPPVGFDPMQPAQKFADGGDVRGFQTPVQRLAGGGAVEDQALAALRRARDAQPVGSPNIAAIDQSIAQRNQSIGGARSALSAIAAPFQKPLPAVPANPTDMRLAAGSQTTPMEAQAPEVTTDAQRGGAAPAVQVPSLSQPSAQPAPAQPVAQALAQVPMLGAVEAKGFQAPSVRHSGNNWKSENDLRNLRVSASSIMNNGGRWDQHGKGVVSPERAAYMQALQTDAALQGEEVKGQQQAMAQGQSNARAAMQQTGENQRTSLREQGFATRDQRKAGMDERTLAMQETESGFKTRAQAQLESLRNTLLDPNATTEQKAQAQAQISALNGAKGDQWKAIALQGGTDAMGNKTEGVLAAVNERTGEMKRFGGDGKGAGPVAVSSPQQLAALPSGAVYIGPDGKQYRKN